MRSRYLFRAVPVLALLSVCLWNGVPSFGAEVPERLGERLPGLAGLTADQEAEVWEILTEHLARLPSLAGRPDAVQEIEKLQNETLEKLGTVLTPEELAQLRASMPAFSMLDRLTGSRAASGSAEAQEVSPAACSAGYNSIVAGRDFTEAACSDGACDYNGHAVHNPYSVNDYLVNCQTRDAAANAESLALLALNDCNYADDAANAADTAAAGADSGVIWAQQAVLYCNHPNICAASAATEASNASAKLREGAQHESDCFACCFTLAAPTNLYASATGANSIKLTWKDTNTKETNTKIERSTNAGAWTEIASVGANDTDHVDTGAASTLGHKYKVRAFNSNSNCPTYSPYSAQAQVPRAPTDLTGTKGTGAQYILNWQDRSAGINESGFEIQRRVGTGGWEPSFKKVGADVETTTVTLVAGVNRFRVRAFTSTGETWFTNVVSYTY